jgi:hypothetical protein
MWVAAIPTAAITITTGTRLGPIDCPFAMCIATGMISGIAISTDPTHTGTVDQIGGVGTLASSAINRRTHGSPQTLGGWRADEAASRQTYGRVEGPSSCRGRNFDSSDLVLRIGYSDVSRTRCDAMDGHDCKVSAGIAVTLMRVMP